MSREDQSDPTKLQKRAERFRRLARNFLGDDVEDLLVRLADELDAKAAALKVNASVRGGTT